jgi:hyperosmotically inducible protein
LVSRWPATNRPSSCPPARTGDGTDLAGIHAQIADRRISAGTAFASELIRLGFSPEVFMIRKLIPSVVVGLIMFSTVAFADAGQRKDLQVFNDVATAVNHYTQFTIFDDVDVVVKDGTVTLTGDVTMPYKRDDIEKRVAKVDGVHQVSNQIKVLPVSTSDDQLRYRIARAIYNNPNFWNYAIGPNPPIHIIVEHGHVTLTGVVNNNIDRTIARSLAYQFPALSVRNELKTDEEVRDLLETIK